MRREERGWGGGGRRERKRDTVSGISAKSPGQAPQPRSPPFGHRFPPRTKKNPTRLRYAHPGPCPSRGSRPGKKIPPGGRARSGVPFSGGTGAGRGLGQPPGLRRHLLGNDHRETAPLPFPGSAPLFFFYSFGYFFLFVFVVATPSSRLSPLPSQVSFWFWRKEPRPAADDGGKREGGGPGEGDARGPGGGGGCSRLGAGGGGCRCPVIAALPAARRGTQLAARDPLEV